MVDFPHGAMVVVFFGGMRVSYAECFVQHIGLCTL